MPLRFRVSLLTFTVALVVLLTYSYFYLSSHSEDDSYFEIVDGPGSRHPSSPLDKSHSPHRDLVQWWSPLASEGPLGVLKFSGDGLVRGWDGVYNKLKSGGLKRSERKKLQLAMERHPILELMERNHERWENLLASQSKTLPQAVTEYTRRYGRPPPKGFDQWWQFCKRNKVKIVDDYDQINRDIELYFALSPELFRKRVDLLKETPHTSQITLSPIRQSSLYGERAHSLRARLLFQLIEPIAQFLPGDITFSLSDHDLGSWLLGDDQKQAALDAIRNGRYLTEEELEVYEKREGRQAVKGLASACPPGSPGWQHGVARRDGLEIKELPKETTFIYDPGLTYDYCYTPELVDIHGALSWDSARESMLRPIFQLSKFARNPEFLTTPLEAYENFTSPAAQKKYAPWDEKTIDKLFWRGSSTGDFYSKRLSSPTWRQSHRPRLALKTQATEVEEEVWVQRGKMWEKETWSVARLNKAYMDVGLTGGPHQCKKEDGTCDEMEQEIIFKDRVAPEDSAKYKYVFDIDGNGWSSRFHRLIMSGSVVLKATIYPEWVSEWLTPWVHYIPCKVDYSDLYDIMSFFAGPPDGHAGGHDNLAKMIADQARQFGEDHWRWEDMQAYMFRLLLEYSRLLADDRNEWSYQKIYT
ncbi:hypothetical protein CNBD0460 [Cryptococcus deneoformans B-3501A]|uniref:Capsular associated protein n=2 Tax=Cryptococcus deneoformans TaxID=40410 RepID=Q5KHM7_CRYD1|nr:capsular associated protein [Cryptococcus neoformans var. neoformans JEC21]XP_775996.1 hypothetical protein CNBD0460 [Cryptococcus neoformans var. neoformans B-3501A]AAN75727.2 CAP1 [Cryptococcus neoformans var. neoformans]AAW43180.1 capsular associated protein [Cryptococcus neoformans var. neoformans JEC21]EAL21349.1 hypothetical protein CNBD0460 [Cryptococcus neoformans var. neoformans B-3501A]